MPVFDLRAQCSRYFRYADLIECGETWRLHHDRGNPVANLPTRDETFTGIALLAGEILDPLHDRFGPLELTYGFAGPSLTKHIHGRISPPHDQHAGSEMTSRGALVCKRQGQSCDLRVASVDMLEVASWVRANLAFDRMYLYGDGRPLHVSYGPERAGKVYAMVKGTRGVVPHDVTAVGWDAIRARFSP
jgi:hypothetical protein